MSTVATTHNHGNTSGNGKGQTRRVCCDCQIKDIQIEQLNVLAEKAQNELILEREIRLRKDDENITLRKTLDDALLRVQENSLIETYSRGDIEELMRQNGEMNLNYALQGKDIGELQKKLREADALLRNKDQSLRKAKRQLMIATKQVEKLKTIIPQASHHTALKGSRLRQQLNVRRQNEKSGKS